MEEDTETGEYVLYRREDDSLDEDIESGGARFEMARNIVGLEFVFHDSRGEEWDSWDSIREKRHSNNSCSNTGC